MNDPDMSKESRDSYSNVAEKAVNMTESIKHAIVLLQVNPYYFRGKANVPVDLGFFFCSDASKIILSEKVPSVKV